MLLNHYGHVAVRGNDNTPENAALQEDLIGVRPYLKLWLKIIINNWGRTTDDIQVGFAALEAIFLGLPRNPGCTRRLAQTASSVKKA